MTIEKKGRGRPKGSGKVEDIATMQAMAARIVDNPQLKPTTAHKQVVRRPDETAVRRVQGKWKMEGARYLAAAQRAKAQRVAASAPVALASEGPASLLTPDVIEQIRTAQAFMQDPVFKRALEIQRNPVVQQALRLAADPTVRDMRALAKSLAMQAIRDMKRLGLLP